jgi:hypothetical protein
MTAWEGKIKLTKKQIININETTSEIDSPWTLSFIDEQGKVLEEKKGKIEILNEGQFKFIENK